MDVISEYIILLGQGRQTFLQAFQRQTVGGVDAGRAQDADGDATAPPPGAQLPFGINPPAGARIVGGKRPGLINQCPAAITVDPCRAYVNEAAW